ncbi:MAG: hypothetical protein OHK0031_18740 [Anaerolineales bacterium]
MLIQVVSLQVSPENRARFLQIALENVSASRAEPGVLQFDLLEQEDAPNHFLLYEVYRSQADLEAHRLTPHFELWAKDGVPLLIGGRVRTIYHPVE